ncbi:MAG: phosphonopyruvate decarboxylase [Gammaproteobacteria bacterium]|nr:phosphonopyruvate decarboxylase [Gammaproteobacteria bacterium]
MIDSSFFYNNLIKEDIKFFTGVPDSLLKNICFYISDKEKNNNHIITANEGNALSLGIGYYLATKKLPLIYMQNSGLGNIINPLLSLADKDVYSIPMILLIGWRGEPNIHDEPQHKKQGKITLKLLKTMDVPYYIIDSNNNNSDIPKLIKKIKNNALKTNKPHAIVVKKGTFHDYKNKKTVINKFSLTRSKALSIIIPYLNDNDIIVSTTGYTSRELFEYRKKSTKINKNDFLVVGGMGHASQIALGIALQKKNRNVYCLDGDGSVLMHMGSLAINSHSNCSNFKHIVFNNGCHESVGGQPTLGFKVNFQKIAQGVGYSMVTKAKTKDELIKNLKKINTHNKPSFLEIMIKKGTKKNLGRPTTTPIENKKLLLRNIK